MIIIHEHWVGAMQWSHVSDGDGAGNDRGETLRMNGRGREGTHQSVTATAGKAENAGFRPGSGSTEIIIGS